MDLTGQKIKPAEGMLVVRFVDDDVDDDKDPDSTRYPSAEPVNKPYEGCLAVVAAVGDKVKAKVGSTIVTDPWAREGLKLGNGLVVINSNAVKATLLE